MTSVPTPQTHPLQDLTAAEIADLCTKYDIDVSPTGPNRSKTKFAVLNMILDKQAEEASATPQVQPAPVMQAVTQKGDPTNIPAMFAAPARLKGFEDPFPDWSNSIQFRSAGNDFETLAYLLVGPTGSGKTEWAAQFAARNQRPFLLYNIGDVAEKGDVLGDLQIVDGDTKRVPGPLLQILQLQDCPPPVIVFDELNRSYTSNDLNPLFPGLDPERRYWDYDGIRYHVPQGTVFFGTANVGAEYTGVTAIDPALAGRFVGGKLTFGYPPRAALEKLLVGRGYPGGIVKKVVQVYEMVRADDESTLGIRQLIQACETAKWTKKIGDAIFVVFAVGADEKVIRAAIQGVLDAGDR